jgi:hypothetical protein
MLFFFFFFLVGHFKSHLLLLLCIILSLDVSKRVWYCGRNCQEKNWEEHKHMCGTQHWRKTILYFQSKQQYDNTKASVIKNINGTGVSMQINTTTLEMHVFCI